MESSSYNLGWGPASTLLIAYIIGMVVLVWAARRKRVGLLIPLLAGVAFSPVVGLLAVAVMSPKSPRPLG